MKATHTGVLHWGKAVSVDAASIGKSMHSAWYDHSYYKVPFTGTFDGPKLHSALHKKFSRPSFGKFGGGTSVGSIEKLDDGHILVELIYHIGD